MADCFFTTSYQVEIVNRLPNGNSRLVLHCASGNDDFGNRTIFLGQDFKWHFCENFFRNTLFFCHLWWGSKNRAFEVFNSDWATTDCESGLCFWAAQSDGIYYQDGALTKLVKKYDWN
ncbi:hypothetical protein Pfo_000014 [Paulownia fortunei]|nr:hypothetical protein Pfo_000014 [Paulownia fortunei]